MVIIQALFLVYLLSHAFIEIEAQVHNKNLPRLTIVIVVDQCTARAIYTAPKKTFTQGIKRLLNNSIVYHRAFFPHGKPETAVGHAALNTGACAEYHGFVANEWYENNVLLACDSDSSAGGKLLDDSQTHTGKSPRNLMVDGISDQFALANPIHNHVLSISQKSRAAIATAGHLGHAIWFNNQTAEFTSSKAYFDTIPRFVEQFNKKRNIHGQHQISWIPCTQEEGEEEKKRIGFELVDQNSYQFSQAPEGFFNKTHTLFDGETKEGLFWYLCSPKSMIDLFELGKQGINHYLNTTGDSLLLWISISALDKIGHIFGPDSFEARDFLCHLDHALEDFILFAQKSVGKKNFVCFFTSDHGVTSMPEVLEKKGLPGKRIMSKEIIDRVNETIKTEFAFEKIILDFLSPFVYLNHDVCATIDAQRKDLVMKRIKSLFQAEEGVKQVWHVQELFEKSVSPGSIEEEYKKQIFKNRSGDFIVQPEPFYLFTEFARGASHETPYASDTHVPLIFYAPRRFLPRDVYSLVSPLQIASTLSALLRVPVPSAAERAVLPGIFTSDPFLEAL